MQISAEQRDSGDKARQAGRGLVMQLEDLESPRDLHWGMGGTRAASGSLFEGWVKVRRCLSG